MATETIVIKKPNYKIINLKVNGLTPLLMNGWTEESMESIRGYDTGKVKTAKQKGIKYTKPEEEIKEKIHRNDKKEVCMTRDAFYGAILDTAVNEGLNKSDIKRNVSILGEDLVPIKYKKQVLNESMGRKSGASRTPTVIFRPEFRDWSCVLSIRFNADKITPEDLVNLFNLAGLSTGIGSWRKQCSGMFGQFEVSGILKK